MECRGGVEAGGFYGGETRRGKAKRARAAAAVSGSPSLIFFLEFFFSFAFSVWCALAWGWLLVRFRKLLCVLSCVAGRTVLNNLPQNI